MELQGKNVVVTGAGRGIGEALARAFHAEGARLVIADLQGADAVAATLDGAVGMAADVSTEAGNKALIEAATEVLGPIDLFFANAGVGMGTGVVETDEDAWETSFAVNVNAHRWAAKHLLPMWLERGEGYFCSTASAAGLLIQIGSGPYTVSKRAAVAFAEFMAITYGDQGIKVSCLCPQGVNTDMLTGGGSDELSLETVRAQGVIEPEDVADAVIAGLADERFLILPHPEVATYAQRRAGDPDRWLAGMRRLQARIGSS